MLDRLGLKHTVVDNRHEALKRLEEQDYNLILMDVHKPELNGLELTKLIRQHSIKRIKEVKICALTAVAMEEERNICLAAGMNDYMTKPFTFEDLKERIAVNLPYK